MKQIVANAPYYPDDLGLDAYAGLLRGVFVGGCVDERNAWSVWENAVAHAHNHVAGEWFGWICIVEPKDVLTKSGLPTSVLLHELAHLLAPESLHGRQWKKAVTALGAAAEIERCGLKPLKGK